VGIAVTNREGLFVATGALKGNPYDGHTLQATIDQAEPMSGAAVERAYVDKSYRGDDYEGPASLILSGRSRGLTPQMKRELMSRSAIEPMIGHAKNDGRLGRNHFLGHHGDKNTALLAASGHNLRLILDSAALLFARILAGLLDPVAKPDTWPPLPGIQKSIA
jgi:IS5 family transposase